jgi:hypothetical protein
MSSGARRVAASPVHIEPVRAWCARPLPSLPIEPRPRASSRSRAKPSSGFEPETPSLPWKHGQRASMAPKADIPLCVAENGGPAVAAWPSQSGTFRGDSNELRHPHAAVPHSGQRERADVAAAGDRCSFAAAHSGGYRRSAAYRAFALAGGLLRPGLAGSTGGAGLEHPARCCRRAWSWCARFTGPRDRSKRSTADRGI